MYEKKPSIHPFTTQLKNLTLLVALVTFDKLFKCLVNRYTRTNLIWKSSVRGFCFGSSSVHHATPPFQQRKFPFWYLSCFRNIQPAKTTFAPEKEYCFLLLLLQAIVIIMGIALINAKAKSVIVFATTLFSWGIEGDSLLMNRLALSCNSQSYDDLRSVLSQTP